MTELDTLRAYYDQVDRPTPERLAAIRRKALIRRSQPRRWPVLATAAAGLATVAIVAIASLPTTQAQQRATPADMLELAAVRAAAVQPLAVGDRILYTRTRSHVLQPVPVGRLRHVNGDVIGDGEAWYTSERRYETWASARVIVPDRSRITMNIDARPFSPTDAEKLRHTKYPWNKEAVGGWRSASGPGRPGPVNPTPAYLESLPTDPAALLARIRRDLAGDRLWPRMEEDQQVFLTIATLASTADALLSPELRAALFRAAALLPGIERIPGQVDLAGRRGVAIARTAFGDPSMRLDAMIRVELIIDEETSRVIGMRNVLIGTHGHLPAGTVLDWETTDQRIVSVVGATE